MEINDSKNYDCTKLKHMMVRLLEQQQEQSTLLQEKDPEQMEEDGGRSQFKSWI